MQYIDHALSGHPQDAGLILTKARILKRQATTTPDLPETERQRLLKLAVDYASQAIALLPGQAEPLYNKACYQALLDAAANKSEILANLQSAFTINSSLKQIARNDSDLADMRKDPDFKRLVGDADVANG
jgi:hypothetical protein